jgi:hypothetical protein
MPKISFLDQVASIDGSELVVLVKDGQTKRGAIGDLVEATAAPFVNTATVAAEAVIAASAAKATYNSIEDALAPGATVDGDYFYALSGVAPARRASLYRNDLSTAFLIAELVTPSTPLGEFTGSIISADQNLRGALQDLETSIDDFSGPDGASKLGLGAGTLLEAIVLNAGLWDDLSDRFIQPNVQRIKTSGFVNEGRGEAFYRRWVAGKRPTPKNTEVGPVDVLPPWGRGYWWQQSADGAFWVLDEAVITSDMFGTVGDANKPYLAAVATGTDVTLNLIKALRYVRVYGFPTLWLSPGKHLVAATLHVGSVGTDYVSMNFFGMVPLPWGTGHDSLLGLPVAALVSNFNDRSCINVQGGRGCAVRDIAGFGPLTAHVLANRLGSSDPGAATLVNDWPLEAWNPGGGNHQFGRYNSGAFITVDCYANARPVVSYPDPEYDGECVDAEGRPILWNKALSSDVQITNIHVSGFSAAYIVAPNLLGLQADFVTFENLNAQCVVWALSVGNGQSRGVVRKNFKISQFHTAFTNNTHGAQAGGFDFECQNVCLGQGLQAFDVNTSQGEFRITGLYGEGIWRLGNAVGYNRVVINGLRMLANGVGPDSGFEKRGFPMVFYGAAERNSFAYGSPLHIEGDLVIPYCAVFNCSESSGNLTTRSKARPASMGGTPLPQYMAQWHNATAGGVYFVSDPFEETAHHVDLKYAEYLVSTGLGRAGELKMTRMVRGEKKDARRDVGVPYLADKLNNFYRTKAIEIPNRPCQIDQSSFASKVLDGVVLTTTHSQAEALQDLFHLNPGDIAFHKPSGALFACASRVGNELKYVMHNGFLDTDGVISWPNGAPSLDTGNYLTASGRWYVGQTLLFGDVTAGSPDITQVGDGQGTAELAPSIGIREIQPGDAPAVDLQTERSIDYSVNPPRSLNEPPIKWNSTVESVDHVAQKIIMSAPAVGSHPARPLAFRRRDIPNVAAPTLEYVG